MFWGVFGPILALFRPKQAFVGQNRAKTPPKHDFLVKKWPQGHPQRRREGGSEFFSHLVHTYIRTYVGGAPLSPHVHTQKDGKHPPPPFVTVPYETVTRGGVSPPPGTCVYRRREEAYHYTHVGGGCVGTTFPVWTRTQCAFAAFFPKNRVFRGSPEK